MLLSFSYAKNYFEKKHFVLVAQSQNYTGSTHGSENKLRIDLGTKLKYSYPYSCDLSLVTKLKTKRSVKSVNICKAHCERDCLLPFIHGDLMVVLFTKQAHHGLGNELYQVKHKKADFLLFVADVGFLPSLGATQQHTV